MPLFQNQLNQLTSITQTNFGTEKELHQLIERNLGVVFNCRFVATEFSTGLEHAGRIDTLALSEDNNPVIIEYKKVESSELINQSLFYLAWLRDHTGDFEIAVQKALGPGLRVDWADVRVICIAPNYRKYDLHAVKVMGPEIELWTYRLYDNGSFYLEEILQKTYVPPAEHEATKNPVMVAAGRKAAITKATAHHTFAQHLIGKPDEIKELVTQIRDYVMSLDTAMEESPKKVYIAYRISQNIVCMEVQRQKILLFLKLDPSEVVGVLSNARDVSQIGHYGTGDVEVTVRSAAQLELAKPFIEKAYQAVGG